MLQPREADLPFLFLIFVVFPLLAYILLGKWSDAAKRRERVNLLAQLAAEESLTPEPMPTSPPNPPITLVPTSKSGLHVCARCSSPATTRCSRCKSVRYCSGKCQILHWRQVHKLECQRLETTSPCSFPKAATTEDSIPDRVARINPLNSICRVCNNAPSGKPGHHSVSTGGFATVPNCSALHTSQDALLQRQSGGKGASCKSNREILRKQDAGVIDSSEETYRSRTTNSIFYNNISNDYTSAHDTASAKHETQKYSGCGDIFVSRSGHGSSSSLQQGRNGKNAHENGTDCFFTSENRPNMQSTAEIVDSKCSYESAVMQGSEKAKSASHPLGTKNAKSSRSMMKVSREQLPSEMERESIGDGSKPVRMRFPISASGSSGAASFGIMKMMGLKNPTKPSRQDATQPGGVHRKTKMLFPYEEFVKIFTYQAVELSPRGLVNCGNSCYANAVLQCLTCTKPLMIFLLHRSHSRACRGKDWCLMCELEQLVIMLRDCGGPLSPSGILLHVRNTNCQIGDGSQEDAHEFLRLLVGSMQSICLEGLGGEDKVDPTLQETTFIQHTFGGRLRSKVKCLRCHHESERYENIMDLSLEIFGWVESLEDALTQFTTTEELDGENMYRCGRCATYVRARKQLSIDVAPNILTIVLKRFQEGKYGKLNKYITFPEMLDMVPFMTGMCDIPPLYMLYAVVVHLDTLNASFSGHYVAYVKDMQGSWFRVDDTEVHPVPMSQVMSEEAYILFYMRSCPRPQRLCHDKASRQEVPASSRQFTSRTQKPSRQGQSKSSRHFVGPECSWDVKTENVAARASHDNSILWEARNGNIAQMMEFSDATSSDWSLFTSSDEASFTTESTRDSFSVFDYSDVNNAEKLSPLCNLQTPEFSHQSTLCSRRFSISRPQSRYISEERGYVLDSYLSTKPPEEVGKFKGILDCSNGSQTDRYCTMSVNYKSNLNYGLDRTSSHCKV